MSPNIGKTLWSLRCKKEELSSGSEPRRGRIWLYLTSMLGQSTEALLSLLISLTQFVHDGHTYCTIAKDLHDSRLLAVCQKKKSSLSETALKMCFEDWLGLSFSPSTACWCKKKEKKKVKYCINVKKIYGKVPCEALSFKISNTSLSNEL